MDENGQVLNARYTQKRATDYLRAYCDPGFKVDPPYEDWETELYEQIDDMWDLYRKCLPDVGKAYEELPMEVYKDGVLSGKIKRLMALTGALVHGCRACVLFQADKALAAGAAVEEILEACAVAVSLGGTMGAGETTRVVKFLDEKGLLDEFKRIGRVEGLS